MVLTKALKLFSIYQSRILSYLVTSHNKVLMISRESGQITLPSRYKKTVISNRANTNVVKLDQMTINLQMLTDGIHGQSVKRKRPLSLWVEKA